MHMYYERWFLCKRTDAGILKISRSYHRDDTSPSILQAIKTMVGSSEEYVAAGGKSTGR
jgi:hypothetical protein